MAANFFTGLEAAFFTFLGLAAAFLFEDLAFLALDFLTSLVLGTMTWNVEKKCIISVKNLVFVTV